jgi:FAD:protein FMN transferase
MGSDAHVIVVGGAPGLVDQARDRIEQLESRWSRFRADSEISALNRDAGSAVSVSVETVWLIERSIEAWRLSGGAFDPTVLGAVRRAGYDRSFDQLDQRDLLAPAVPDRPDRRPAVRLGVGAADITVDGSAVTLPVGTGFDPGGIGKGLAADLVVADLLAAGAEGACVNLGGDVRVAGAGPADPGREGPDESAPPGGSRPSDAAWTVAVWHPELARPMVRIGLVDGAVATSTTLLRRWRVAGVERHHLIDPRSGQPSDSDLDLATVVAAEAWMAEILAKSVILRGSIHPFDVVESTAAQALAVDRVGSVQATPGLTAFLGDQILEPRLDLSGFADPTNAVATPAFP